MPTVEARVVVSVPPDVAFAVSQTTGEVRKRWDPFIRRQQFLHGAQTPQKGVQTETTHRLGFTMVSQYVSYEPPSHVGMKMVSGSWFFQTFAGGWRFHPVDDDPDACEAVWRYSFQTRPDWLSPLADRVGEWLLGHEIRTRIAGFARACEDPVVVAAATEGPGRT